MNTSKKNMKIVYVFFGMGLVFALAPLILFGTNSVITIHDNLDSLIPWYKMFHDNNLFFKFNVLTKGFSEMSTLYYSQIGFTFQCLLYSIFDTFAAYTSNCIFSVLFGILSMYLLVHKMLKIEWLVSIAVSVCYALLPVYHGWNIAVGTLPLIIYIFFHFTLKSNYRFSGKVALLIVYPFFSFFSTIGIFILALWFIGTVVVCIKNKKINFALSIGFMFLSVGYILVDLPLFYVMFILKTPLNRAVFTTPSYEIIDMLKTFLVSLKGYVIHGQYHGASMQRMVIVPSAALVSSFLLIKIISSIKNKNHNIKLLTRIKIVLSETDHKTILLFALELVVFIFSGIGALYDCGLLNGFIKTFIPVLVGFNWGRVWLFNRIIWMIIFALCLSIILSVEHISFNKSSKQIVISPFFPKLVVSILIFLQTAYTLLSPVAYNDRANTWFNELAIKTGIAKIITWRDFGEFISYKEFFAQELFHAIKDDIDYTDERVAAFGYHPSVLMYNGFNCIDGYNNAYPLQYMEQFRTLIAPEFETNIKDRDYYDSWGGRMYIYHSALSYVPVRDKNTTPVELHIDMNVFKKDFNGRYILSRAEISNAHELGLLFIKRYDDEDSIYTIYLYKTD
jgi:hypothetical protein